MLGTLKRTEERKEIEEERKLKLERKRSKSAMKRQRPSRGRKLSFGQF